MTTLQKKHAIAAFAALSLAATLAGCTSAADDSGSDRRARAPVSV